jgi:DNA-binding transcriptional ArsR family regulator
VSVSLDDPGEPTVSNQSQPRELTASAVFDLLSNERRRSVIHFLLEEPETTVRELSRHVAAWENDVELSAVSATQRKRVYTGLHQTHLPRLDEHGVLEYDFNRGDVRATERLELFEPYFEPGRNERRDWTRVYLGLGAGITAYALAALVGVPGIAAVPPAVAALVGGTLLLTLALVHATEADGADELPHYPDLKPSRSAEEAPAGN